MMQIDVVSIPVSDQQRAKAFYQKLGFKLLDESPMANGNSWVQLGLDGSSTTITLVTWFSRMPPGSVQGLVIRTDDLGRELGRIRSAGIEPGKTEETPWGKFSALKDPDGNGVVLQQR